MNIILYRGLQLIGNNGVVASNTMNLNQCMHACMIIINNVVLSADGF